VVACTGTAYAASHLRVVASATQHDQLLLRRLTAAASPLVLNQVLDLVYPAAQLVKGDVDRACGRNIGLLGALLSKQPKGRMHVQAYLGKKGASMYMAPTHWST
jgi:hypothetical protein